MTDWKTLNRPLILASQSPRRQEILTGMGLNFQIVKPLLENEAAWIDSDNISQSLEKLALAKALSVAEHNADALILGADTVVMINGSILGKPSDATDASAMLTMLSGGTHQVYSAVALHCAAENYHETACVCTMVYFRTITRSEIADYLEHSEYRDKAGAYAIQGKAMTFIEKIDGCYYNVVGLPVAVTIELFRKYTLRKEQQHAR
ncbi:MAG: septum formation protein Maf [Chitinivibrionales bacterium]|nr:septum formation protein Maf [Chitinivibrionales bacterium]